MPRQHSPRRPTPAEQHAQNLYDASQDRFWEGSGSRYPCSQRELDFHHWGRFETENSGPFVSLLEATQEVMVQNDERRRPSSDELEAIAQLNRVIRDRTYRYHPDLIVKAFNDLDTVFFGGRLHGNVLVSWANSSLCAQIERERGERFLGKTQGNLPGEQGLARIWLNPEEILLGSLARETSLQAMFGTLLHEMVHAYEQVRNPELRRRGSHDEHFGSKINVIHRRAVRIFHINVIGRWEDYRQGHRFVNGVDESRINRPASGRHDRHDRHDDHHRDGHGRHGSDKKGKGRHNRKDDRHRDDHGRHHSDKKGKGRRDERSRSRDGDRGRSNKVRVGVGALTR